MAKEKKIEGDEIKHKDELEDEAMWARLAAEKKAEKESKKE